MANIVDFDQTALCGLQCLAWETINELCNEKTCLLHMENQRHR